MNHQDEMERRAKLMRLCRHDGLHYLDDSGNRKCSRCDAFVRQPLAEQFEEIDRMLFDAGVLVLSARSLAERRTADQKITDARVKLEQLRRSARAERGQ